VKAAVGVTGVFQKVDQQDIAVKMDIKLSLVKDGVKILIGIKEK
jgi:hypothetical protein